MPLEFFLTGDLKFLLDWCGVHSKLHFCLFCDVHRDARNKCFKLVETQAGDTIKSLATGENTSLCIPMAYKLWHFITLPSLLQMEGSLLGFYSRSMAWIRRLRPTTRIASVYIASSLRPLLRVTLLLHLAMISGTGPFLQLFWVISMFLYRRGQFFGK